MQEVIDTLLSWGYVILFLYSIGGGMVGILAAGILSASGHFSLSLCIFIALFANVLGSTVLFLLGRYFKKDLKSYFKKHKRKIALAQLQIKKYGVSLILLQKFIYGLKTFIPLAAGFARYDFFKFFVLNFVATVVWAVGLGYLGFAFGASISYIVDSFSKYSYAVPLFLLALIILIYFYLAKFSKKR